MKKLFKILVVDDEERILDVVKAYLEKEDYEVITAMDGEEAIKLFKETSFHLIILDLMLPKLSGEEVCSKIRESSNVPIIMLTAKVEEEDKLEGLSIGADDYLTKPFSVRKLVARVKALIRRAYRGKYPLAEHLILNDGDLEVDIRKMKVLKNGKAVTLTPYEFKVLVSLLTNPGQVFTREQLVEQAFGYDYESFDRTVDTYIKNIRQKIEDNPKAPNYITTVYGVGYRFGGKINENVLKENVFKEKLSLGFLIAVIGSIIIASSISNYMINNRFNEYLVQEHKNKINQIIVAIEDMYKEDKGFQALKYDEIKRYAVLNELYIEIKDKKGSKIFTSGDDHLKHRSMMNSMMGHGMGNMMGKMKNLDLGDYKEEEQWLKKNNVTFGKITIGYFGTSYLNNGALTFKRTLNHSFIVSMVITFILGLILSWILSKQLQNLWLK